MQRIPPLKYPKSDDVLRYADFDQSTGSRGSVPPASFFNVLQDELLNLIVGSGLAPNANDLSQVLKAVQRLNNQRGMQVFTVSGTFTVPANVTKIFVEVIGGGGGGGGTNPSHNKTAAGGGGGGRSRGAYTVVPGATYAVTIGAGGAGGTANGGDGSAGGTSSFGALISATGGGGGGGTTSNNVTGGASGVGAGGSINEGLGDGSDGFFLDVPVGTYDLLTAPGQGGGPGGATRHDSATAGRGYGGGGGGVGALLAASTSPGGAGKAGLVIVEW